MKHSTPPPRMDDIERFAKLRTIGCIVSRIHLQRWEPAEIHHLVEGYRLGHQFTIPLSPWFHRGVPPMVGDRQLRPSEAEKCLGPSLARSKRAFVRKYGTERDLLEKTNQLVAEMHL